jgi:hypothetical protein
MARSRHNAALPRRSAAIATLAFASALLAPGASVAATPIDGGPITIFPVVINASTGTDEYDPHVSGDIVSYTASDKVRYYDFFSGSDVELPSTLGATDLLSEVSNGRIVFSRVETSGQIPVMLFDIGTAAAFKVDPRATEQQYGAAIGASTVALIDLNLAPQGELVIATVGGPITQVTADTRTDQAPSVGPLGDLVVYESCGTNCDIRQAVWNGSSWVVGNIASTAEEEHNPDTDGALVVYDSVRSGDTDIAWQPVGGGPEQRLELPGEQRNPSIRAGVIAFESIASGTAADMFLYQVATNRLFRVTSTPTDESLSDIDALSDGRIRLVWSSGEFGQRDVYGATIELPPAGPTYHFGGFQQPVDARPTLNQMKAGGAVPVKFGLGGNQGLSIFAAGYPKSQAIACDAGDVDGIETTVTAGGSSLTYDSVSDTYSYVWKTDKAWAGTCRQLVLAFADGSVQRANFKFK